MDKPTISEILVEARRLDDALANEQTQAAWDALTRFHRAHFSRLAAVAEAAVEMRAHVILADDAEETGKVAWLDSHFEPAVIAFDAALRSEKGGANG